MGVAIVTGAARGIGAAVADALHRAGHDLVLVDRCQPDPRLGYPLATEADLAAVAERCGDASTIVGDVASMDTHHRAIAAASDRGGLDIAVAAAGVIAGASPAWEIPDDAWAAMIDTNLHGTSRLARVAIPALLERALPRQGRFVAVSSAAALKATARLAGYSATKAAVIGLVRSLAADLGGTGITANVVQPGSTDTPLLAHSAEIYDLADPAEFAQHHLDDRLLDPTEVAAGVAWLCSEAASGVTGAVLPVDGGMTAS